MTDLQKPEYKAGDKVRLIENAGSPCGTLSRYTRLNQVAYIIIDRVELKDHNPGYRYRYTAYDKEGGQLSSCSNCVRDHHLEPYDKFNQGKNTMKTNLYKAGDKLNLTEVLVALPDRSRPEIQRGDKFVVVRNEGSYGVARFTVVEMYRNDNSQCPAFVYNKDGSSEYIQWSDLAEIPASLVKTEKPEVTGTATYYSDGVKVSEDKVEFDGKNWEREELQKTIARYQEIARRPFATVAPAPVAPKRVRPSRAKKPVTTVHKIV